MQVVGFRITNFRSIADTGWRYFSSDSVTVLIGQNESGKSSVLEALAKTFSSHDISDDDKRIGEPLPKVHLRVVLEKGDEESVSTYLIDEDYNPLQIEALEKYLSKVSEEIELIFSWTSDTKGGYTKSTYFTDELSVIIEDTLKNALPGTVEEMTDSDIDESADSDINESADLDINESADEVIPKEITLKTFATTMREISPTITLFDHETGLLPSFIDVRKSKWGSYTLGGSGSTAANNFLTISGLNLKTLIESDNRTRESLLAKANAKITKEFSVFWSQTIGRKDKLVLECDVQRYGMDDEEKRGEPYLEFWISDGLNKLYPKQRSQGVRWFVSFYLQLKASEMHSTKRLFLLDEPGANLHSKAQSDVIKLINDLSKDIPIVYSTHIPHMLEYDKLYRVLAVQRIGEEDDSPTEVKSAHELGTASTDTLSPVLTAMGVDLANQEVIKKYNNVLLEEMSGFYYLKAIWELTEEKQEAHFIAATGVNKIPVLANMFLGWGLEYIVVVDDDKSGRAVFNTLKKEIFADDEILAKTHMFKIKGCDGIENIFSERDFKKYVISDASANITKDNSTFMKDKRLSKPVHAYTFLLKVQNKEITFESFEEGTKSQIESLVKEIVDRLK